MSFDYFAYGSNLWLPQLGSRCPSARLMDGAILHGWDITYDKPSFDTSSKLNIRPASESQVEGAVLRITEEERPALDAAEPGYEPFEVDVVTSDGGIARALTYKWVGESSAARPYDWYVAMAKEGARANSIDPQSRAAEFDPDPLAPGLRPMSEKDLGLVQSIVAEAMAEPGDRYSVHPGEILWWTTHDDPRFPNQLSCWIQDDVGVLVINSNSLEVSVFANAGYPISGMIEWAQRRLASQGEVALVTRASGSRRVRR